jgi:hypothetical protein
MLYSPVKVAFRAAFFIPMFNTIAAIIILVNTTAKPQILGSEAVVLASKSFSLEKRYDNTYVNTVFKDNILLTLHYLEGDIKGKGDISWEAVEAPFNYQFSLAPGEGFAFHDQILPEYENRIVKTTNAHFNYNDGFKSDGYLTGDGVCHLASLIYWAAKDAGLESVYFARHDFAKINEVPKEYGVSIKFDPTSFSNSARQNLYIVNNQDGKVTFTFAYDGTNLSVDVTKTG